jgi:hypothetical protein
MAKPIVDGPAYGTDARTARLALEEKGIDLAEFDLIAGAIEATEHLARHPFGKAPRESGVQTKPKLG